MSDNQVYTFGAFGGLAWLMLTWLLCSSNLHFYTLVTALHVTTNPINRASLKIMTLRRGESIKYFNVAIYSVHKKHCYYIGALS